MRVVATLCALGVAATLGADPAHQCEPAPRTLEAFAALLEHDWWRLSPKELDALWPHPLRSTGCGTEEGRCLDLTWCGLSPDRPDECVCRDQFSFGGPAGHLRLAFFGVSLEVSADEAPEVALKLGDTFEATGRAIAVECGDTLKGALACHEWPADSPAGQTVTTSIWMHHLGGHAELSAEASVVARQP